jgi:hypothetical protein
VKAHPIPTRKRAALARMAAAERVLGPVRMIRDGERMAHYDREMAAFEALNAYDALVREQEGGSDGERKSADSR